MEHQQFAITGNKIIIRIHDTLCESSDQLLSSPLFREALELAVEHLIKKDSSLLNIFEGRIVNERILNWLVQCLKILASKRRDEMDQTESGFCRSFLKDVHLFHEFVEFLYNFWRRYDRFIICDSRGRDLDKRPYRTFNATVGQLTQLIRGMYRDIQENLTGDHPRIYRQVAAGAQVATISISHVVHFGAPIYDKLSAVSMIRQILLYPPLILNPPMNKRKGEFFCIEENPITGIDIDSRHWLCYPAKVGTLVILIYIHHRFIELGLSLCNLFELASDDDLMRKPDALLLFGVPGKALDAWGKWPTVFHEDKENDLLIGAIPNRDEFGYFGYLKKMALTLHNIICMKRGRFPFHGALVRVILKGGADFTVLFLGDTGAGKSETLEALRELGEEIFQDMIIICDDMGSIELGPNGQLIGYGTEIGAFLRLDDLKPGYALDQVDRAIIMSPNLVNARIILPVTDYANVIRGQRIDYILYANNYESIDSAHPIVERFDSVEKALDVFREGTVMSKGTTETSGIVHVYFANIFGPAQFKALHEELASRYFKAFFEQGIFVGQIRTRLGLRGFEQAGPEEAALALISMMQSKAA